MVWERNNDRMQRFHKILGKLQLKFLKDINSLKQMPAKLIAVISSTFKIG
jgi:hypothetical protein